MLAPESREHVRSVVIKAWRRWRASPDSAQRVPQLADLLQWTGFEEERRQLQIRLANEPLPALDREGPVGRSFLRMLIIPARRVRAMVQLDRTDQAVDEARQLLEHFDQRLGVAHGRRPEFLGLLAEVCAARGELIEAEELFRTAKTILARSRGELSDDHALVQRDLAAVLRRLGRPGEAVSELRPALDVLLLTRGQSHWETARARYELALALEALGQTDEAARHRSQAEAAWLHVFGPGVAGLGRTEHPETRR